MTDRETLVQLKKELPARLIDPATAGEAVMALVNAYGAAVTECWTARDYAAAEVLLGECGQLLDAEENRLSVNGRHLARARYEQSAGNLWLSRAEFQYYLESDFVSTPRLFERAEGCFERAIARYREIEIAADQQSFRELRDGTIALLDVGRLDVHGMKLFVQGEFEREAGDLERAETLLRDAIQAMRQCLDAAGKVPAEFADGPSLSSLFLDYAEASLQQAVSDGALLLGKLDIAAEAQRQRADALDRCQAGYARLDPKLSPGAQGYWPARLARDAFIARQRHERLDAAAARQPRVGRLNLLVFGAVAVIVFVGPVGGALYLNSDAVKSWPFLLAIAIFAMLVGGVTARLASWADVTDRLQKVVLAATSAKPATGSRPGA